MMTAEKEKIDPILIDVPVPIVTERLFIRPPMAGDGVKMRAAKQESWNDLKRWLIWAPEDEKGNAVTDEKLCRQKYAQFILREDLMFIMFDRQTGDVVGGTGLHRFDWSLRHFEIGYWVRQSAQGQGYATESTNALIRFAFGALAATRVSIAHADGNEASRRVIEKLGFVYEGTLKQALSIPDRVADRVCYARFDTKGLPDMKVDWGAR